MGKHKRSHHKRKRRSSISSSSSTTSSSYSGSNKTKKILNPHSSKMRSEDIEKSFTHYTNKQLTYTKTGRTVVSPYIVSKTFDETPVEQEKSEETDTSLQNNNSEMYGPILPSGLLGSKGSNNLQNISSNHNNNNVPYKQDKDLINDMKDNDLISDEDVDIIGPLPDSTNERYNTTQIELENRAKLLKHKFSSANNEKEDENKKRESWMLELPAERSAICGLSARKFSARDSGDKKGRSVWTDTPDNKEENEKKRNLGDDSDIFVQRAISQKDRIMSNLVDKCKNNKNKSLLEIHRENRKKKKKNETCEEKVRRPFSRDTDLQANRFDEAQKKSIIKKAQLLDSRFAQGQSKYL